jgi:hypothetical protein
MFFVVRPNRAELIQIGDLIDTGRIRPVIETCTGGIGKEQET